MSVRPRLIAALATTLAAGTIAACGDGGWGDSSNTGAGPTVVAATTQVGDMARAVAGRRARVEQILEANSDPHEYEPRPADIRALADAGVVLRSGGDLDDWLGDVLENAGGDARTVTLIDAVRTRRADGEVDPHWWQDPRNGILAVRAIRDALIAADPAGRATYDARAASYVQRLQRLDREIATCFARIPEGERKVVTDHDSLGYYADRYAITIVGTVIPALSTQAQASAADVAQLARTIRAEGVTTVFTENSGNRKLAEAIARDSGAKLGADLYADSLGTDGSPGATYVGSLQANTHALIGGLGDGQQRCSL